MSRRKSRFLYTAIMVVAVLFLAGCPNNLVDTIEEEVAVVVTPPSVISIYPAADAVSISADSEITITFSKSIDSASVTGASFVIKDQYGSSATGHFNISNDTITFIPNNLFYGTDYTVTATAAILDVDGNQLSEEFSWSFKTQAAPAGLKPLIQLFTIDNGKSATGNSTVQLDVLASDYNGSTTSLEFRYKLENENDWSSWVDMTEGVSTVNAGLPTGTSDETFIYMAEVRDSNMVSSELAYAQITYKTTPPAIDPSLSNPAPGASVPQNLGYVKVVFDTEMDTSTITSDSIYVSKGLTKISTYQFDFTDNKSAVVFSVFELGGSSYSLEPEMDYTVFISSTVADVAGNAYGTDYTYFFRTDAAEDTTAPDGSIVLDLDSADLNATNLTNFDLMIKATDDFNGVRSVKIWGDSSNTGTYPYDEQNASWVPYVEGAYTFGPDGIDNGGSGDDITYMSYNTAYTMNWDIISTNGDKFIYYRFIDYANNESPTPGILRISLDTLAPVFTALQVDGGTGFSNNTNNKVNITFDASDAHSGLDKLWISSEANNVLNTPASNSGTWEAWSPLKTSYSLGSGEGKYYFYSEVKDFVGNLSGVLSSSIILDYTSPDVSFSESDILEVNTATAQTVTVTDPDPGALNYQIPSGIATYSWEKVSGPGTIVFSDSSIESPNISASASDGSEDGIYELKLTVSDNAGNIGYNTVNFTWDTVDPGNIGTITAYNANGTQLTTSANSDWTYTASAQPYATWTPTTGADFYTIIPNNTTTDPNNSGSPRYWDDPSLDWDNPATYSSGYMKNDNPIVTAPAPANPGDNDGPTYLYVAAWDNAGNRSNRTVNRFVKFWIDTLPPVITNLVTLPPSNSSLVLDYRNSDNGGDGRVYDQRTADDPVPGTEGSGISSYIWTQTDGPGTLTIQNSTTLTPTVSANADGQYELELSVTDMAGNTYEGYTNFIWDTTAPNSPSVNSIDHTPSVTPIWTWSGSGGGNGNFRYRLDRISREWSSNGGSYSGSSEVVFGWTAPSTTTSYNDPTVLTLTDKYEYTLFVEEQDDAGNWSASGSKSIWIDTDYTSEPAITRSGLYLRNAGDRSVTWNWTTGLGNPATERYRYKLIDSSSNIEINWTTLADNVRTFTIDFSTYAGGLPDDIYTLIVEEFNVSTGGSLVGKEGSSPVQIDATAPNAPTMRLAPYSTGITTSGDDPTYYLTNDNTPRLWWLGDSTGGSGNYRWNFDGGAWTYTSTYYIYSSAKADGAYIFYVQERDAAGNWSGSASYKLEIDTTAPTLSSILLTNRSLNAVNTTTYTVGTSVDIGVTGSGTNNQTYTGNDIRYMRFWNSGGTKYTYVYNSSLTGWNFATGGGDTSDGTKYVYCELEDYAGNVSVTRSDGIILDTVPPAVTSFYINNSSDMTTASTSVTLNSVYSGANYMRISTDGGATWNGWYTAAAAKAWTLSTTNGYNGYGAKKVMVQFTDLAGVYTRNSVTQLAGHDTDVQDSIFYGTPVIRNSYKGILNTGYIRTYYEDYEDVGDSTNTYYIYYSTSPTGTKYQKGSTTSSTSFSNDTYTKGTLYYLFVRVYNPDIGWSDYSDYSIGFSSDMTIIYDDTDSDDTSFASTTKQWITRDWASLYPASYSYQSGSYVAYTVTLVPESLIPTTYSDFGLDTYDETIVYGNPIITTPSTGLLYSSAYSYSRAKNITFGAKGLMGMHYNGWRLFQTISNYAAGWGYTGTLPTGIDYAYNKGDTQQAGTKEYYSQYDYIWHKYLKHDSTYTNERYNPDFKVTMFTTSTTASTGIANRWSIYNTAASGTSGLYYWADDPDYPNYYSVARQGEFVYWGYNKLPAYVNASIPFFYNAVRYLNVYN